MSGDEWNPWCNSLIFLTGNEQSSFYVTEKEFLVERIFVILITIVSWNNRNQNDKYAFYK